MSGPSGGSTLQAHLAASTLARYETAINTHVLPKWGNVYLSSIKHADVQQWVSRLAKSAAPTLVAKVHRVFSLLLAWAVRDSRMARNLAEDIRLPRPSHSERRYLDHSQVATLANRCGSYGLIVRFLAYTGLRWGELAALMVGRVDLRRGVLVAESVTEVNGALVWGGHPRPTSVARCRCLGSWLMS